MADVMEITADNFQAVVLENEKPVLIDFWAEWCGPCRMIAPVVEQIAKERADSLVVGKLDGHFTVAGRHLQKFPRQRGASYRVLAHAQSGGFNQQQFGQGRPQIRRA